MEIPVLLGSISGMRASEIIGLRWSAVDLNKGIAKIKEAKVLDQNREYVVKGTKTRAGTRTIRLLPHVCDALRRHYDPSQEYVVPLTYAQVYDRYQKALSRCCPDKHYTFHELRHYACSVMIWMGMPVKYIADYLGHETENMVNQVYGHIMADKKDAMFDKLVQYYDSVFKNTGFEASDTKSDTSTD
jgi:integrase